MSHKYTGGCDHIHTHSDNEPIDNHVCHCSVCKSVTGQETTHVVFFDHRDLKVDNEDGLKRQPFNAQNPDGPLEPVRFEFVTDLGSFRLPKVKQKAGDLRPRAQAFVAVGPSGSEYHPLQSPSPVACRGHGAPVGAESDQKSLVTQGVPAEASDRPLPLGPRLGRGRVAHVAVVGPHDSPRKAQYGS